MNNHPTCMDACHAPHPIGVSFEIRYSMEEGGSLSSIRL